MPTLRRKKALLLHLVYIGLFLLDVGGCGCGASQCSHRTRERSTTATYRIQQTKQIYTKCSKREFVLLKMGTMMPEKF